MIDIDILLYDTISIQTPLLTIPHRHYLDRPFVFIPLHDIIDTQNIYYEHIDKAYQNYIQHNPLPNDDISLINA
ncbi:2-amino-4-hydroxy-6-hydroxymethyldihydropteridine diphosphokinase [Patescibacteria group bacterium]|nr:2-amino-4-hydroxy-6-hydroxymethyldihydropteridine diphosphokinase [Patescibacteria group bacterium]